MKNIVICSSANFFKQVIDVKNQLEKAGFEVDMPATAEKMRQSGDYEVNHYKTWFANANDYPKKAALIREHFAKIEKGDAILVLNYPKNAVDGYIGGSVFMEITLAFHLHKPIFLLNELPAQSPYLEEITCLEPTVLHGKIEDLVKAYPVK